MPTSFEKDTGKFIEDQPLGSADTLIANAVSSGIDADNVEIRDLTRSEVRDVILAAQPEPDYAELRRRDYGPLPDQLDMQYWDAVNGTTEWRDHVSSVKAAHPKPE